MTNIRDILRPGDVINSVYHFNWRQFYNPLEWGHAVVAKSIQNFQRDTPPDGFCKSTHSRLYLGDGLIFEVTWPVAKFTQLDDIRNEDLRISRHTTHAFTPAEMHYMYSVATDLLGYKYDLVELLSHLLAKVYPQYEVQITDLVGIGKKNMTCMAGVRTIYEALRKNVLEPKGDYSLRRLFTINGKDTLIELSRPEHGDNCPDDFRLVATFKKGVMANEVVCPHVSI